MSELDASVVKGLAGWDALGHPVSSLYLDVDGRRYPREQDVLQRAGEISHRFRDHAARLPKEEAKSVACDAGRMLSFLEDEFERGSDRGLALFASHAAGLWEDVRTRRPLRDRATVAEQPYLLPLEALLETQQTFCTVLVDRARARVFLAERGRIEERGDILDDIPDEGRLRHVADRLLGFFERRGFSHLILGGPDGATAELEHVLHPYLSQRIAERARLPATATPGEVLETTLAVEERMEAEKEARTLERLHAHSAAGRRAVLGIAATLEALNEGRVETLVVPMGAASPGVRCPSCGLLASEGAVCPRCGSGMEPVIDIVDTAVATALRRRTSVEVVAQDGDVVGALLRY